VTEMEISFRFPLRLLKLIQKKSLPYWSMTMSYTKLKIIQQ